MPGRLKRLLWVICLNGSLIAIEGILQRLSGTNKLLWILEPESGAVNKSQFGPFDYYANAAQYLNLVWPVCLALWWCLRHERQNSVQCAIRAEDSPHVLLLPAVLLLFAAAIFAGSRGGALLALGLFVASAGILFVASEPRARRISLLIMAVLVLASAAGAKLGGWQAFNRLLTPPRDFPTGIEGGLSDFSLCCLLDCPREDLRAWWVAYLAPAPSNVGYSSAFLFLSRGFLGFRLDGDPATNRIQVRCTNFVERFHGRRVSVTAVREGTNLTLYADGTQLPVRTYCSGSPPLTNRVGSSYLRLRRDADLRPHRRSNTAALHRVQLYTNALSPTQIDALASVSSNGENDKVDRAVFPSPVLDVTRKVLTSPSSFAAQLRDRTEIHKVGKQMASDSRWLGSGPGTFGPLFQLYRVAARIGWNWYAHNDYLETRITFGRIGILLASGALGLALLRPFTRHGVRVSLVFLGLLGATVAVCLVHGRFDYPFQVHSVIFLFLVWVGICSIVTCRT